MGSLRRITGLMVAFIIAFPQLCAGEALDVRAGEIAAGGVVNPDAVSITLRGSVNAADLHYIAMNCRSLQELDISGVDIEAYRGDKAVAINRYEFPAGVLPAYSLSGLMARTVALPAGIKAIGDGALLGAEVQEIVIPDGVTSVGTGAFAACRSLRKVTLAQSVTTISPRAFNDCSGLTEVSGGMSLTGIGEAAFGGCSELTAFVPAAALSIIGDEAFSSTGFQKLDFSACKSLSRIGARAFANCGGLEEIILPGGVDGLGEGAFFGCQSLRRFVMPKGLTELPALALTGASGIEDTAGLLHDGVSCLGAYSLAGMASATAVELPASLVRIDNGAFEGWTSLGHVMAEALSSVPALGDGVWAGVDQANADLTVADGMEQEFMAADQWREFRIKTPGESGIEMVAGSGYGSSVVKARFERSVLEIRATDPVAAVAVYDVDGRLLYEVSGKDDCELTLPTGLPAGKVYIVSLRLTAGRIIGLKIINE